MEVVESTPDRLVLKENVHLLRVLGVGCIVLAVVSTLCASAVMVNSGNFSFVILLPLILILPGIALLMRWHFRMTCTFDKQTQTLTLRYLGKVWLKTARFPLSEIQSIEVVFSREFEGGPLRELVLVLGSGERILLSNSTFASPMQLGASAMLVRRFLGLPGEKRDLVLSSIGVEVQ